jgi:hydroxyacylglutathione hydrolase
MINVIRVPAFSDNYLWLFHHSGSNRAYAVDPGDAQPIEKALQEHGLTLAGILVTHHHWDHTGGVDDLLKNRNIPVYGPHSNNIAQITHPLKDNEYLDLEDGAMGFKVLEVPGHTLDHIAYFSDEARILFSGDTLFAGGCGRMFEGQPAQMQGSLARLAVLPEETAVYCAHEYTESNLAFALAVEPENEDLVARVESVKQQRARGEATVPSSIGVELKTNPFLRVAESSVIAAAEHHTGTRPSNNAESFAAVRGWKDNF